MTDFSIGRAMALSEIVPSRLEKLLRDAAVPTTFSDGQLVYGRGDQKRGLSLILSGQLEFGNPGKDGSYIVILILGPGQVFGEFTVFADLPRTHDAVAMGETVVGHIDKAVFDRLAEREPDLLRHFLAATALRLHFALEFLDDALRLPLTVRIAKALRHFLLLGGDRNRLEGRQEGLANVLGVTRVSVNKALQNLQRTGLVQLGRGRITVPNPIALDQWIEANSLLGSLPES